MGGFSTCRSIVGESSSSRRAVTTLLSLCFASLLLAACQSAGDPVGTPVTSKTKTSQNSAMAKVETPAGKTDWLNGEDLVGLADRDVSAALGTPTHIRKDDPAEIWQYSSQDCVLDFYLYQAGGGMQVAYVEARDRMAQAERADRCVHSLLSSGDPAVKTAKIEKTADASQ
ncbi:hypothetical protein ACFPL7_20095 [Dongia soli]|uniref:Lipoprotein n=1 Tax=Dongia soli TaxID=600628 RepID=A0ABU5E6H4_9PROT|nr:hypothetical protein [Dongia soli]MDY0881892.1 hypothetical protein [Dongia soli]